MNARSERARAARQILPASSGSVKYDQLLSDKRYRIKLAARNPSGWGIDSPVVETRTTLLPDPWMLFEDGEVAMVVSDGTILATEATLVWYGPATGVGTDAEALRGSAQGFQVIACEAASSRCFIGEEYFERVRARPPLPPFFRLLGAREVKYLQAHLRTLRTALQISDSCVCTSLSLRPAPGAVLPRGATRPHREPPH
jgi:hypothetical protein